MKDLSPLVVFCLHFYSAKQYAGYKITKDTLPKFVRAAAVKGDVLALRVLIALKVNLNEPGGKTGKTALDYAREKEGDEVVALLQTHGATSGLEAQAGKEVVLTTDVVPGS